MSTPNRPFWSGLPARILGTVIALAVLAVLMIPPSRDKPDDSENGGSKNKELTSKNEDSECIRDLSRLLNGLQPGRLGIDSDSADLAIELNRWFSKCGQEIDVKLTQDENTQRELLSDEIFARTSASRFLPEDAAHVRLCLLADQITKHVCANMPDETEQAVNLFQYVTRHIMLMDEASNTLPKTPYEALVWGQGTAEHRAWTFATLLRPLRIDSFIITPTSNPGYWVVGVQTAKGEVLLFDPKLGLPIPSLSGEQTTPFPTLPATLAEIKKDGAALRALDSSDLKYPLTKEDFAEFSVSIIGTPSLWSRRMAELQYMLDPLLPIALYDGLGENALRPNASVQQRTIAAGKKNQLWQSEQIQIWKFPYEQLSALELAKQDPDSAYALQVQIFAGPQLKKVSMIYDEQSQKLVRDPQAQAPTVQAADTTLHAVRIEQLQGNHRSALKHFGPILSAYRTNATILNEEAANYAALWAGESQLDIHKTSVAIDTLDRFVATARQSRTQLVPLKEMRHSATDLKMIAQIVSEDFEDALATLKAANRDNPSLRYAYLIQRWEQLFKSADNPQAPSE